MTDAPQNRFRVFLITQDQVIIKMLSLHLEKNSCTVVACTNLEDLPKEELAMAPFAILTENVKLGNLNSSKACQTLLSGVTPLIALTKDMPISRAFSKINLADGNEKDLVQVKLMDAKEILKVLSETYQIDISDLPIFNRGGPAK